MEFSLVERIEYLLNSTFPDFHKQELSLVLSGLKLVCRQGKYDDELDDFVTLMNRIGLVVVISPFKVIPFKNGGYAEGGMRVGIDDPHYGMRFVYVSLDELNANLACYYDLSLDDSQLGYLLGYPPCCIDYFKKNFSSDKVDLSLASYNSVINISLRADGFSLLSHFPCSSSCSQSTYIAYGVLRFLEKCWPERALVLQRKLNIHNPHFS